jgi:CRISPR system Cascade subunit CasE
MYLSRLWLNPRSPQVQRALLDCHLMHQRLMLAFPADVGGRAGAGLLYRIEPNSQGGRLVVLAQSRVMPSWATLPAEWLLRHPDNPRVIDLTPLLGQLTPGLRLSFRLRANPTRKVDARSAQEGRSVGQRVPLREERERLAWLERYAQRGGFVLEVVMIEGRPVRPALVEHSPPIPAPAEPLIGGRREVAGGSQRLTFEPVLYEGILRITDEAAFRATLLNGIGPGKAYGMGLLSIGRTD